MAMLAGNFFEIQTFTPGSFVEERAEFHAIVSLNSSHPVYQGHFPGNPIVPGVCQIQMVKELIEKAVALHLRIKESENIKFLSMINPEENPKIEFNICIKPDNNLQFSATASITSGSTVFLKFKGKFETIG